LRDIAHLTSLLLVNNLSDYALKRPQAILGLEKGHHATVASSKGGEGFLAMFQAEEKVKIPDLFAVQSHVHVVSDVGTIS